MENLHIHASSFETRKEFLHEIYGVNYNHPVVQERSEESILREWAAHKLLFSLHLWEEHTLSVDLECPQKFILKVGYFLVGVPALWLYR